MKFWKATLLFCLMALPVVQGCKKDDDETKEYLNGSLKLDLPTYVEMGFSKDFCIDSLMTVSRPDGKSEIGYYFKNTKGVYDTLKTPDGVFRKKYFTVTVPDSLGTFSATLGAFCPDTYYGTTGAKSLIVVSDALDGKGSITGYDIIEGEKLFKDERDGREYCYVTVGDTDWMRQNLAWRGAGVGYQNSDAMSGVYGRYYSWEEAKTACPEGWTLPSESDWVALGKAFGVSDAKPESNMVGMAGQLMGDLKFNKRTMWEYWRNVKITNTTRLSVMPSGYAMAQDGDFKFDGLYKYAAIWSSDSLEGEGTMRYIYQEKDILYYGIANEDFYASVRCIRK